MIESKILKNEQEKTDLETGEVITTSKTYKIIIKQDEFYMSYIENMSGFFKLRSAIDIKVLTKFCMIAEYETGKVIISQGVRKEILTLINITTQQLTNSICNLKKLKLISGERGDYYINPLVYWKGKNETRNNILKSNNLEINIQFGYLENEFNRTIN